MNPTDLQSNTPEQILQNQPLPTNAPPSKSHFPFITAIFFIVFLLAAGIYLIFFVKKPVTPQTKQIQYARISVSPFKSIGKGLLYYISLAGTAKSKKLPEQRMVDLQTGIVSNNTEFPANWLAPDYPEVLVSPDNSMFVYSKNGQLLLVDRLKHKESFLVQSGTDSAGLDVSYGAANWSPDGKYIQLSAVKYNPKTVANWAEYVLLDVSTKQIISIQDPQGPGWEHYCGVLPKWSPDSTKLLFFSSASTLQCSTPGLYVIDVANRAITPLNNFIPKLGTEKLPSVTSAIWSWDGKHIYFQRKTSTSAYKDSIINPDGTNFSDVQTISNLSYDSQLAGNNKILYSDNEGIWGQNIENGQKEQFIADNQHYITILGLSQDKQYLFYQTGLKAPASPLQIDENPNTKNYSIKISAMNLQTRQATDLDAGITGFMVEGFLQK